MCILQTKFFENTIFLAAPTSPPQDIEGVVFNSSALSIRWRPPPFEDQNGIIVGYIVRLLEIATNITRIYETSGSQNEVCVTSLHPYYGYEFKVAAKTVAVGVYSASSTIHTDEDGKKGNIFQYNSP